MGFIEAFIPAALTMETSNFDSVNNTWVWGYQEGDRCKNNQFYKILDYDFPYQTGDEIKFSVYSTDFSKPEASQADIKDIVESDGNVLSKEKEENVEVITKHRYNVIGS